MLVPPVATLNNNNHADPNGFTVWWRLKNNGVNQIPTMTVSPAGATVQCMSRWTGSAFGCNSNSGNYPYCRCLVTGTKPDTTYTYTVSFNGHDYSGTIRTRASALQPQFSFDFYSDTHNDATTHQIVASRWMIRDNPDFAIHGGDVAEYDDQYSTGGNDLTNQESSTFYDNTEGFRAMIPVFVAVGNHDYWGMDVKEGDGGWPRMLNLWGGDIHAARVQQVGKEYRYYSFDYGNTHVTVLDTGFHTSFDLGACLWVWTPDGNMSNPFGCPLDTLQMQWFKNDLAAATANPAIRHKIVVTHANAYYADHDDDEVIANKYMPEISGSVTSYPMIHGYLKKYGVELVLSGHRHLFQHLEKDGVQYVICSGVGTYDSSDPNYYTAQNSRSKANFVRYIPGSGYCNINVSGSGITVSRRMIGNNGVWMNPPVNAYQFQIGYPSPSNPAIVAGPYNAYGTHQMQLTWSDNAMNEIGYEIWRSTSGTSGFTLLDTVGPGSGTLKYVDASLPAPGIYYYKVRAVFKQGTGKAYSDDSLTVGIVALN